MFLRGRVGFLGPSYGSSGSFQFALVSAGVTIGCRGDWSSRGLIDVRVRYVGFIRVRLGSLRCA